MEENQMVIWDEIKTSFSETVESHLHSNNCRPLKTVTGAYVLPKSKRGLLDDCQQLLRSSKLSARWKNLQSDKLCLPSQPSVSDPSKSTLRPAANLDLKSGEVNTLKLPHLNLEHPLNTCRNGRELAGVIFGCDLNDYRPCLGKLSKILEDFIRRHKRCHYKSILTQSLQPINKNLVLLKGQMSRLQLNFFFRTVYFTVVPKELFGSCLNGKMIRKMVQFYWLAGFDEYFSVHNTTKKLRIKTISWLQQIPNEAMRWTILAKLMVWFFNEFALAVFGTHFNVERPLASKEKHVFVKSTWKSQTTKYVREKIANKMYVEVSRNEITANNTLEGTLNLQIKKNGVRPIVYGRKSPEQKEEMSSINRLLFQLTLKKFDVVKPQKFYDAWSPIVKAYKAKKINSRLYFISSDINDAYGSINQQKLLEIFYRLIDDLPDNIGMQKYAVLKPKFDLSRYIFQNNFVCQNLPLALPANSLCCQEPGNFRKLDKNGLKTRLEAHINKRQIKIFGKYYYQKKGLSQGISMMGMLSELYYSTMVEEEFESFKTSGHFFRYVDDFLYITEDRASAERFLQKIQSGVPHYNCTFSQGKTHTNLEPYCEEEFVYLGFRFNIRTLEVVPIFPETSIRYLTTVNRPAAVERTMNMFKMRLLNMTSLKIEKIVLDAELNSSSAVIKSMRIMIERAALRCSTLLLCMFTPDMIEFRSLFKVIRRSVNILKSLLWRMLGDHSVITREELKVMVWQTYLKIFEKHSLLASKFRPRIRSQLDGIIKL